MQRTSMDFPNASLSSFSIPRWMGTPPSILIFLEKTFWFVNAWKGLENSGRETKRPARSMKLRNKRLASPRRANFCLPTPCTATTIIPTPSADPSAVSLVVRILFHILYLLDSSTYWYKTNSQRHVSIGVDSCFGGTTANPCVTRGHVSRRRCTLPPDRLSSDPGSDGWASHSSLRDGNQGHRPSTGARPCCRLSRHSDSRLRLVHFCSSFLAITISRRLRFLISRSACLRSPTISAHDRLL